VQRSSEPAANDTAQAMRDASIQLNGVARRYGTRWALAGVTLDLAAGSVVMLAGRNGAGKSTLLRILATAIRPDRGAAIVAGFDVVGQREDVRRLTALVAHQNYLYEALTARENLEVVADHLRVARQPIGALLQRVGLSARAADVVGTFSAGMRKRLSLARLLLQGPRVALLDEPYGALDPAGFVLVDEVIRELQQGGSTVVWATHQWERASRLSDVAVILDQGRVTWSGNAAGVVAQEAGALA
jgi:heme exporter protein A